MGHKGKTSLSLHIVNTFCGRELSIVRSKIVFMGGGNRISRWNWNDPPTGTIKGKSKNHGYGGMGTLGKRGDLFFRHRAESLSTRIKKWATRRAAGSRS